MVGIKITYTLLFGIVTMATTDLCQPPREGLRHGEVSCTRDNFVNSVYTFTCTDPGYYLLRPGIEINSCLSSQEWSQPAPCCRRPCPPSAKLDVFFVLDSSSSLGATNWEIMKEFIRAILASFTVSPDASHFAVIRYNRIVDAGNQITLNDYTDDKDGLLAAFDRIPYDGFGTRTAQALQHVSDVLMTLEYGDRPDVPNVLIVVTDGKSQDDVLKPSADLRKKGVSIFAIGIQQPKGRLDETELSEIAGDPNNVLIADGFTKLDANLAFKLTDKLCVLPCLRCGDEPWELAKSWSKTGGVIDINIPGLGKKEVYCDMRTDGGEWIVFQRRMDGSEDFYRDWVDYVNGFGARSNEFWLGLEAIHQLTKDGNHELRIDMIERNGTYFFAKYSSFKVDSASTNYTLSADGFSGNASESFKKHSGFPFSTSDWNNGNEGVNCAEKYGGAWWYYRCHLANLNGRYNSGAVYDARGISWNIGPNKWMHMRFTEMKLRKKN